MDKEKYEIDIEENVPQIVYGIPDFIKEKNNGKEIFHAFEGGYFGPSLFFFINQKNDKYEFRFGYSEDGRVIRNDLNDPNLKVKECDKEYYDKFINEVLNETKEWKNRYVDENVMDGTQWNIDLKEKNIKYYGSNAFPDNYDDVSKILVEYFDVNSLFDIKPDENVPYEVYGIPDADKYDIKPEDNVPQRVYGIPDFNKYNKKEDKKCPYCGSSDLWEYLYGEPRADYDREKYVLGGCIITPDSPSYKCQKCKKDIFNNIKMPDLDESKKNETIYFNINGNGKNYALLFEHDTCNKYCMIFSDLAINDIKKILISDKVFNTYKDELLNVVKNWDGDYRGDNKVIWSIDINTYDNKKEINGLGGFPNNWNKLIDLVSMYEKAFKFKKDIELKRENKNNQ